MVSRALRSDCQLPRSWQDRLIQLATRARWTVDELVQHMRDEGKHVEAKHVRYWLKFHLGRHV